MSGQHSSVWPESDTKRTESKSLTLPKSTAYQPDTYIENTCSLVLITVSNLEGSFYWNPSFKKNFSFNKQRFSHEALFNWEFPNKLYLIKWLPLENWFIFFPSLVLSSISMEKRNKATKKVLFLGLNLHKIKLIRTSTGQTLS